MTNSLAHENLVKKMTLWVEESFNASGKLFVYSDDDRAGPGNKPPVINNKIPDLYARDPNETTVIVGEAETTSSIRSRHAFSQIYAFMEYLHQFENSVFVLAVPFLSVPRGRSICRKAAADAEKHGLPTTNIKTCVIHELS